MNEEYKFGEAIPAKDGKRWSDDPEVYALIVENERLREALHDISISQNSMYQEARAKQYCGLLDAAVKAEREKVARWMISKSYATGHGDTIDDLLEELEWQVAEREREACARICDETRYTGYVPAEDGEARAYYDAAAENCAEAIRARGEA